jgi:CheY-like chemotaxis protein
VPQAGTWSLAMSFQPGAVAAGGAGALPAEPRQQAPAQGTATQPNGGQLHGGQLHAGQLHAGQLHAGQLAERRGAGQLDGATVLIVDDDVRNVFALTSALEMHGMTVLYADNGADGVRLLSEHSEIDIVLMDAMMPGQDGNETTRTIRRNQRFADLPVVFLTAKAMPGDRESSFAAGASDYLTKPVDLDELLAVMAAWINGEGRAV